MTISDLDLSGLYDATMREAQRLDEYYGGTDAEAYRKKLTALQSDLMTLVDMSRTGQAAKQLSILQIQDPQNPNVLAIEGQAYVFFVEVPPNSSQKSTFLYLREKTT